MKCHYEVLGIGRDAVESDIKKSYRKLALQWHPDKNLNNQEEAREQFQLVQQAYEVLSDSHERAWYDNHREQILRGKNSDYEDNSLDVFQYFTVTCFKGFGDDPGGFYAVYAEVFGKIASEDVEFMQDEEDILEIPKFGTSESNYEETVGTFYAYWQSYCTKKSYSWLCKYDITEIKDRRILREIEKETKKLAQKARRERNEEVRNLVSFVKKRDRRVQAYRKQLEEKAEMNRKKQEQNRLEQIRKRNKELEEMKISHAKHTLKPEGYETQLRQLEQEYGGSSEEEFSEDEEEVDDVNLILDEDEEEITFDDLYCVSCNKVFKNQNALINHEISQKHLANIQKLKAMMLAEENLNGSNSHCDSPVEDKKEDLVSEENDISEEELVKIENKKGKKNKKQKKLLKAHENHSNDENEDIPDFLAKLNDEDDKWSDNEKKSNKKVKTKKTNPTKTEKVCQIDSDSSEKKVSVEHELNTTKKNTIGNKKDLKANKNADLGEVDISHVCVTCHSHFASKNKLFTHLKQVNHGVYLAKDRPVNTAGPATSKKNKKK